jgi:diguanylate cyclase (GGDEF)-like protein
MPMLLTDHATLQRVLEQLEQATLDHAAWRDQLLRVVSGRQACDPNDLSPDAHRRCQFGQWYFHRALPEVRELPSFAMIGAEHENQHRIAAKLLRSVAAGVQIGRSDIEAFEEASSRLSFAMYFIRREIECAVGSRDALTAAHSSGEMLRDLREWHALGKQPGRQCCIALMELDTVREISASHGNAVGAQAHVAAVKIVSAHLRLSDKVFRYEGNKFLVRLSGTDLASGRTVIARLREAIARQLAPVGAGGVAFRLSASFGVAMLDPEVDALESVDRADHALTLAKTAGRNQIICWDPSVTTGVRLRRLEVKDVQGD